MHQPTTIEMTQFSITVFILSDDSRCQHYDRADLLLDGYIRALTNTSLAALRRVLSRASSFSSPILLNLVSPRSTLTLAHTSVVLWFEAAAEEHEELRAATPGSRRRIHWLITSSRPFLSVGTSDKVAIRLKIFPKSSTSGVNSRDSSSRCKNRQVVLGVVWESRVDSVVKSYHHYYYHLD